MNKTLSFTLSALTLLALAAPSYAIDPLTPPQFPSCPLNDGNYISNSFGSHPVLNQGNVIGTRNTDDRMANGQRSSNFLDCICDAESAEGFETHWWDVNTLKQEEIDPFLQQGWTQVIGDNYGLRTGRTYLGQKATFSCDGGEVTPTPTPTPTTNPSVTPSITLTPTPTPTDTPTNGGGDGGNGGTGEPGAPECTNEVLPAPVILSVTRINPTTDVIRWTAVSSAQHYVIAYGTQPGQYDYGVPNTGDVTQYEVSALDPNTTYYYQVSAQVGCMPGEASAEFPHGQVLGLAATYGDQLIGSMAAVAGTASTLAAGYFTTKKFSY